MKISIIIPVYNSEFYLKECFDSILNQSFDVTQFEVIIIDDYSTDYSSNIISEYVKLNKHWKSFRNAKNQGPAFSRNLGLRKAKGQYVVFLDSDDKFYANTLKELYDNIVNTESDMTVARINSFDSNKEYGYYSDKYIKKNYVTNLFESPKLINCISICSKIYKKELITDVRFLENTIHEDNSFSMLTLLKANKISVLKKQLYYRRIREIKKDSIMQNLNYETYCDLLKNYEVVIRNNVHLDFSFLCFHMVRKASNYIVNHLSLNERKQGMLKIRELIVLMNKHDCLNKFQLFRIKLYNKLYFRGAVMIKRVIQ